VAPHPRRHQPCNRKNGGRIKSGIRANVTFL
jgi:hypothetical protein